MVDLYFPFLGPGTPILLRQCDTKEHNPFGPCVRTIVSLNSRIKAALAKALYSGAHTSQSLDFDNNHDKCI